MWHYKLVKWHGVKEGNFHSRKKKAFVRARLNKVMEQDVVCPHLQVIRAAWELAESRDGTGGRKLEYWKCKLRRWL